MSDVVLAPTQRLAQFIRSRVHETNVVLVSPEDHSMVAHYLTADSRIHVDGEAYFVFADLGLQGDEMDAPDSTPAEHVVFHCGDGTV